MTLPSVGGGQQLTDGNINEQVIRTIPAPQTATATATLTAAQIIGGIIVADPSTSAASYTLPTVALLEAALTNAVNVGAAFQLSIVNLGTSSGVITMLVGTGWTITGLATIATTSSANFTARKTGAGAWTLYRASLSG